MTPEESHFCARDFRGGELYAAALIVGFVQTCSTFRSFFSICLFSAKGLSVAFIYSSSEMFPASIFSAGLQPLKGHLWLVVSTLLMAAFDFGAQVLHRRTEEVAKGVRLLGLERIEQFCLGRIS